MKKKVAVEGNLSNVSQELRNSGYEVIDIGNEKNFDDCVAIVVTGGDSNFLGMHDTNSKVPVIDASGISAQEVKNQVDKIQR